MNTIDFDFFDVEMVTSFCGHAPSTRVWHTSYLGARYARTHTYVRTLQAFSNI